MRLPWLTVTAVLLLAAAAGCSSPTGPGSASGTASAAKTPSPPKAASFQVVKSGWGWRSHGGPNFATAVAVIKNGSDQISGMNVTFTFYGQGDAILGQQHTAAPIARAGATVATIAPIDIDDVTQIKRLDLTVTALQSQHDDHPTSAFTASSVVFKPGQYGMNKVTAKITSAYQQTVKDVYAAAVCYDGSGAIIGGGEAYIDEIPSGQTRPIEETVMVSAVPASCEMFPTLSGVSTSS